MITLILTAVLGSCSVHQQAVVAQQYVAPVQVQSQVLYFVGAPLRVQSMVEHAKRTDPDYTEFLEFKAWKAGKAQTQQQPQAMTDEEVPPPNPEPQSHVRQHCAKCHSGDTPREFILDGQPGMRPQDITASIRKIVSGEMPKDHKLSREQKNLLLQELLSLEQFTGEIQ